MNDWIHTWRNRQLAHHAKDKTFRSRLRPRWDLRRSSLLPGDDEVAGFVRELLEFMRVPASEELVEACQSLVSTSPLSFLRKLERLAFYLATSHLPRAECLTRLETVRRVFGRKPPGTGDVKAAGLGETRLWFSGDLRRPRRSTRPERSDWKSKHPLELAAHEKLRLKVLLHSYVSAFGGGSLSLFLRCRLECDPDALDLPGFSPLGLPEGSMSTLMLSLMSGEFDRVWMRQDRSSRYQPNWGKVEEQELDSEMLVNTAARWGMRELAPLIFSQLHNPHLRCTDVSGFGLPRVFDEPDYQKGPGTQCLETFYCDLLLFGWDL